MTWISRTKTGVVLNLHIVPRASKTEIKEELDNALKIRIQAPPVDGKANKNLLKFLKKTLKIPANNIRIISGETSRTKRVAIDNISIEMTIKKLTPG